MSNILYFATVQASKDPYQEMADYLNTLYDRCKGFVEILQLSTEKKLTNHFWMPLSDPDLPVFPEDQNIHVGVATRKNGAGGKAGILEIPAVWVDIDFERTNETVAQEIIDGFSLPPSIIVKSGKGFHLYWVLETPALATDIQKIEDVNRRLANHFQGDQASAEAAHLLRMPGTYNQKYNPAPLVTISSNKKTYSIDDFDCLPPIQPPEAMNPSPLLLEENWRTQLLHGVPKGKRHNATVRLASRYREMGLLEDETQILLSLWNEKNIPPRKMDKLTYDIKDAYQRYTRDNTFRLNTNDDVSPQELALLIESSVMRVHDFMHKPLPVKPYIINPLLKQGEIIMISAARGVGKTWFALSLGFLATRQSSIGKWETKTPTATLYVDGEMSEDEMQNRIVNLKMGRQREDAPFYLLSSDEMRNNDKKPPNLMNPSWRKSISDYLKSHSDIALLILDNMGSLTPGRDENRKREWDDINQWLLELRSKGIAVIFLHHEGKGGDQRGTSAIEDNINFSIRLKRPEGYQREEGAKFVVEFTKTRRIHGEDAKPFTLQLQHDGAALDWIFGEAAEENTEEKILEMVQKGMKQKDIAEKLCVSASWVSQVKKKVKEKRMEEVNKLFENEDSQENEASPNTEEVEVVGDND